MAGITIGRSIINDKTLILNMPFINSYFLKHFLLTTCIIWCCQIVHGQNKFSPKISVGFNFLKPVGQSSTNNSWGYGFKAKLGQKINNNTKLFISASYDEILGKSYIFVDDTGDKKVRDQSILPLMMLAGTEYQLNKLFFSEIAVGYGMNTQKYRLNKESSFAYSANFGLIIPKTNNKLSFNVFWTGMPSININFVGAGLNYKL